MVRGSQWRESESLLVHPQLVDKGNGESGEIQPLHFFFFCIWQQSRKKRGQVPNSRGISRFIKLSVIKEGIFRLAPQNDTLLLCHCEEPRTILYRINSATWQSHGIDSLRLQ